MDFVKTEWIERARMMIDGYMRYTDYRPNEPVNELDIWLGRSDHKYRVCKCTHCGESFEVDADDSDTMYRELWKKSHNAWVECPKCYSTVRMKNERLMRGYASMNGHYREMFAERMTRDHVVLHAYYIEYNFNSENVFPELEFHEDMRYDLRPGEVHVRRKVPYTEDNWETVGIPEPWPLCDSFNSYTMKGYSFDAEELMHDTWLQYLPFQKFADYDWTVNEGYYSSGLRENQTPWGKIMCYAALYPQLEYAAKMGAMAFVCDLVMLKKKNARLVNWSAKKPHEFLRMSKQDAEKVISGGCDINEIKLIHYRKLSPEQAAEWVNKCFYHETVKNAEQQLGDDGTEIVNYLIKQKQGANGIPVLRDYRQAAVQLGRDINVPGIRWPKNLTRAHDDATKSAEALLKEQAQKDYFEFYKVLRQKYEYVTPEYMAIVPPQLSDIKLEGQLQHHCVGGYVDRHATGKCTIIFIRRTMLPLIPLYTVELRPDGTIVQIQGFHNEYKNKPSGKAADFVDEWQREIHRRLAKQNKKKTKSKERATA